MPTKGPAKAREIFLLALYISARTKQNFLTVLSSTAVEFQAVGLFCRPRTYADRTDKEFSSRIGAEKTKAW